MPKKPKNAEKRLKPRLIPPKKTLKQSQTAQITKNRWQKQGLTADTNACWTVVFLGRGVSSGLFVVVLCFGQASA